MKRNKCIYILATVYRCGSCTYFSNTCLQLAFYLLPIQLLIPRHFEGPLSNHYGIMMATKVIKLCLFPCASSFARVTIDYIGSPKTSIVKHTKCSPNSLAASAAPATRWVSATCCKCNSNHAMCECYHFVEKKQHMWSYICRARQSKYNIYHRGFWCLHKLILKKHDIVCNLKLLM